MSIPHVVHRIFLDEPSMPAEYRDYGQRWRALHPEWEFNDWRSSAYLPPLRHQDIFDRAEELCPRDHKRFRSDLLRLELLYALGGVYADTDSYPLRAMDGLPEAGCHVAYSPNRGPRGERLLTQAWLAAEPEHPFIGACLDGIPAAVGAYRGRPLAQMIGPWHVSRTFESGEWPDVLAHSESFWTEWCFHAWANRRDNRKGGLR